MFHSFYNDYQAEFIAVIQSLDYSVIETMVQRIEEARLSGNQVFLIGNGGSAASASHWACDFGKGINVEGSDRLRVISLADNSALMSAFGNDAGYENVFVEPLKNLLLPGDVVIGLSVSGDSENVVRAFRYARKCQATIISLVGEKKGRMKQYSDYSLVIPSSNYGIVEDVHMFVNHVISQFIRKENEKMQVLGDL
ncbi:MAG TPA: SIS domain-containing protein [Bacillales bacterium]